MPSEKIITLWMRIQIGRWIMEHTEPFKVINRDLLYYAWRN